MHVHITHNTSLIFFSINKLSDTFSAGLDIVVSDTDLIMQLLYSIIS